MALDFELSEEHRDLQTRVRERLTPFVAERVAIALRQKRDGVYPDEIWQALAAEGVFGAALPPELGGTGAGLVGTCIALEELAALGLGDVIPVLTTLVSVCIDRHGSEELKRRALPAVASGQRRFCFAATEAEAGFNIFRTATGARREGDAYVLDGQKAYISGVDVADAMLVVARTTSADDAVESGLGKTYGISLLLVDTDSDGISREVMSTRGEGGIRQFTLRFDNVVVPAGNLVGEENAGTLGLLTCFNPERIMMASLILGMSRYCLELACGHARERKVFGSRPIGSYQAIQHPLAEVLLRQEAVRLLVHRAAWSLDRGDEAIEVGRFANAAKLLAAELGLKAVDAAIDALGGRAFAEECGLMDYWETARLFKTSPISNALVLNFVAEHYLDLPRAA